MGFGVGFKVKDKENLKVYFGLNIFNGNCINASAYIYLPTLNEPEANPNLPGVFFYTEEIDFIKVRSEQAQVGVNLGLMNSYPLTNFFSVDYGVGFNLGFTAYSETSVTRSQYEGIAYFEHPELGTQRIFVDHNTLFVGNKLFEREDFTNQVRVVSSVTNLSVGFTFSPLKNDLISLYYRLNPMLVHNFSGNLGYSMNSGFSNLVGLRVKTSKF